MERRVAVEAPRVYAALLERCIAVRSGIKHDMAFARGLRLWG